jgi:tRNA dimethylallyltransferase
MKKIISVVGPTATGKTSFALQIAFTALKNNNESTTHQYSGVDLISVDSRQVYKGLEILSGADVPQNFELLTSDLNDHTQNSKFPFFQHNKLSISLHGISIINLDQEWSVAHFKDFATKIILNSFKHNRLPILVGGTGLYHEHLFNLDKNLYVPPNNDLRTKAKNLTLIELQNWLEEVNSEKFSKLNNSDINNPRRLVRAIEISVGVPDVESEINLDESLPKDIKIEKIGMDLSLKEIEQKITLRVEERFNGGVIQEVKSLIKKCVAVGIDDHLKDLPVCSTLGVSDLCEFLNTTLSATECKEKWSLHEFQYAKRQLTWFKKQSDVIWLDAIQKNKYTCS